MYISGGQTPVQRTAQHQSVMGAADQVDLAALARLKQFGVLIETLQPKAQSSERHWHSNEDEFLFVLSGAPTLIDDLGPQDLAVGDAICWPRGVSNGHHIVNHSDLPVSYLIAGSRVAMDICTYPDSGNRQINGMSDWRVIAADGHLLRSGDLPPALQNLPQMWGEVSSVGGAVLRASDRVWTTEPPFTHPALNETLDSYQHAILGDAGGLGQFGVHLECLNPGGKSSFHHWHEAEDEMVLILSGQPTLIEDIAVQMQPGDAACWPAGTAVGHHLENRSDAPAVYLTIGTRFANDVIHYPNHDLITHKAGPHRRYFRRDGSLISERTV